MISSSMNHQIFNEPDRVSQSLRNDRCQNILYKAVFEHFIEIKDIAVLLLASKSFQNSSFGANFLVNFVVDAVSILLIDSVLSPSSRFSIQFAPSLHIKLSWLNSEKINHSFSNLVGELVNMKYFRLSLRSLSLEYIRNAVLSSFFGSSSNSWPQLQELNLEYSGANDDVLQVICNTALQLRAVNFSGNSAVTDAGLVHLSKLSNITSLNISCSQITDVGLENLSTLSGIISLNLFNCSNITDVGLEHVAKLLGITALDVSYCKKVTAASLEHLCKLSCVTSLNLCGWSTILDTDVERLSTLSNMTSLELASCNMITDTGLEHLTNLSNVTSLTFSECNKMTDAGLEHLSKLSRITSLNLSNCVKVTDAGIEHLPELSKLTSLSIFNCNKVTDACLVHVAKLSNLTHLDLRSCSKITDCGLEQLLKLSNLTFLNLWGCEKITAEAKMRLKVQNFCHIKS